MLKFNDYLKEAALSAKQKKIAAVAGDKDKIDAADLTALRAGKKPVEEACSDKDMKKEELVGKQHKLDKNKNGKVDAHDFKLLRKEAKDDWSKNDSLAKPVTSSQAMADHSKYFNKVTKLDPKTGEPIKKDVKEEAELDEATKHEASHMDSADHVYANSDSPNHEDRKDYKEHMKKHFNVTTKFFDNGDTVEHHGSHKDVAAVKKHIDHVNKNGQGTDFSGHETHNVNEEVELDEGRVKELAMDLKDMSHDEFHKQYGKPKSHFDPTNFKKPVEPGKGMDRAKALAQRGMQSLSKEEVERIEEKLTQLDELSKGTLGSYVKGAAKDTADRQERIRAGAKPHPGESQADYQKDMSKALALQSKRKAGMNKAVDKLTKEEVERIEEKLANIDEGTYKHEVEKSFPASGVKTSASAPKGTSTMPKDKNKAKGQPAGSIGEETEQEMSPYLKGTLKVMDEGKIDNLRDAQKLRQDMQSAYDKDYKPDTSHPHIQVVKGNAYGGANQKDDEGDDKPDETKEKRGRGRPSGSKSGARQKGGGHEDGGIPVHNLNLPKSYK